MSDHRYRCLTTHLGDDRVQVVQVEAAVISERGFIRSSEAAVIRGNDGPILAEGSAKSQPVATRSPQTMQRQNQLGSNTGPPYAETPPWAIEYVASRQDRPIHHR